MTAIEWTKKRKITAFKAIHTASTQSTASHDAASTATDFQAAASTAVNFYGTTAASFDATVTASTRLHDRLDRHIAALDSNGLSDRAESNNKHESARLLALFSLAWTRRVLDQTSYILNDFCLSKENGVIGILVKLAGHMKELEDSYNCKGDFDAVIFNEDDFFNKTIVVPDRILYLLHDHVNWTELIDGFEHNLKRRYLPKHQSKWSKVYEDIFVKKTLEFRDKTKQQLYMQEYDRIKDKTDENKIRLMFNFCITNLGCIGTLQEHNFQQFDKKLMEHFRDACHRRM